MSCKYYGKCELDLPCVDCPHRPQIINLKHLQANEKITMKSYETNPQYRQFIDAQTNLEK